MKLSTALFLWVFAFVMTVFASKVQASDSPSWISVPIECDASRSNRDQCITVEYDSNSISSSSVGGGVTWRQWYGQKRSNPNSDQPSFYTENDSELHCGDFFIYQKMSREFFGDRIKVSDFSKIEGSRYIYPHWGDLEGVLLRDVCPKIFPDWEKSFPSIESNNDCEQPDSKFAKSFCIDPDIWGQFHLLTHRTTMVAYDCGISIEDVSTEFEYYIRKANQCIKSKNISLPQCVKNNLFYPTSDFTKDLINLRRGGKCVAIENFKVKIAEEKAEKLKSDKLTDDLLQYLACTKNAVSSVDDSYSNADVVAIAMHSKCRSEFIAATAEVENAETYETIMRPKLIEFVFDWRHQSKTKKANKSKSSDKVPSVTNK